MKSERKAVNQGANGREGKLDNQASKVRIKSDRIECKLRQEVPMTHAAHECECVLKMCITRNSELV